MSGLSLFTIEQALTDLLEAREELIFAGDFSATADEETERVAELAEIEKALAEYVTKEIRKVDGIHFYLAAAKQAQETAKLEARRMAERARRIEESSKRLKALCCDVMRSLDKKRLDGTAGRYLLRKGNGGLQPLIVQEDVLPSEYRDITVRMRQCDWDMLMRSDYSTIGHKIERCEPANDRIRAALVGGQDVPGARLEERGEHLEVK